MVTYEIRKKFDDGHDVCYFTANDFDEIMQNYLKYGNSRNVIKIPNYVDK